MASRVHRPVLGIGTGALFLAAALGSHLAAMQSSGLEALWPSNAVVRAILILAGHDRRDIVTIIAGGAAGSIALHLFYRDPPSILIGLTAANMAESGLAFALLRWLGIRGGPVDRVGNYFALAFAAAVAGLFSSTIGGLSLWIGRNVPYWDGLVNTSEL